VDWCDHAHGQINISALIHSAHHSMVFSPARVTLRAFEGQTISSAAVGDDPVPGWLCARRVHAVFPVVDTPQALGFRVLTSLHFHDGSGPVRGPSTRSPQLPPGFQALTAALAWSPLRVTEAESCQHFCSLPPRPTRSLPPFAGGEGPPAFASIARPAGTQYVTCTTRATCTVLSRPPHGPPHRPESRKPPSPPQDNSLSGEQNTQQTHTHMSWPWPSCRSRPCSLAIVLVCGRCRYPLVCSGGLGQVEGLISGSIWTPVINLRV